MVKMLTISVPYQREALTRDPILGWLTPLPTGVSPEMLMALLNHNVPKENEKDDNG